MLKMKNKSLANTLHVNFITYEKDVKMHCKLAEKKLTCDVSSLDPSWPHQEALHSA